MKTTTLKPISDWVAIEADEPATESPGGVLLPENRNTYLQATEGTVRAVGPGKHLQGGTFVTPSVKVGDRVLFTKVRHTGEQTTIQHDGEEFWLIREGALLAVLNEETE